MSALTLDRVCAAYGKTEALHGVSLEAIQGQITLVLGTNGAGKTTLLRAVAGLVRVTAGAIDYQGRRVTNENVERLFDAGILYQPETRELFASMTVRENLLAGVRPGDDGVAERLDLVESAFPMLAERKHAVTANMSGGERQMVALGRAFMANPRLLLLDEPSLGLAPAATRTAFAQIRELQQASSLTVLLAEQNTRMSLGISDDVYVLSNGAVIDHRPASTLSEADIVRAYFGG